MNKSRMMNVVDHRPGGSQPPGQRSALITKRVVFRRSYDSRGQAAESDAVSYTHLTLPTKA